MTDTAQPGVRGPVHDAKSASTRGPGPSLCAVPDITAAASTPMAATAPMANADRQSSTFITRRLVDLRRRRNRLPAAVDCPAHDAQRRSISESRQLFDPVRRGPSGVPRGAGRGRR